MICQTLFGRRAKAVGIGVILTAALSIASVGGAVETITAPKLVPQYRLNELLTRLPAGERWLTHLRDDLLPFWLMD